MERSFQGRHKAKLEAGEAMTLLIPVEAPEGRYTIEADVEYPPR